MRSGTRTSTSTPENSRARPQQRNDVCKIPSIPLCFCLPHHTAVSHSKALTEDPAQDLFRVFCLQIQ